VGRADPAEFRAMVKRERVGEESAQGRVGEESE
jgi:hypothetical protein